LTGGTPTIWHYFRPQDRNPFVLAWLASGFVLSCVFAYWVLLSDGAKKVTEFNLMSALGQSNTKPPSEKTVKIFAALGVLIFPVGVSTAAPRNVPLPG